MYKYTEITGLSWKRFGKLNVMHGSGGSEQGFLGGCWVSSRVHETGEPSTVQQHAVMKVHLVVSLLITFSTDRSNKKKYNLLIT